MQAVKPFPQNPLLTGGASLHRLTYIVTVKCLCCGLFLYEILYLRLVKCWMLKYTRVIQKVSKVTHLISRYVYHILPLFNIISCNRNALGPAFLQSLNSIVEELLSLLFHPAIFCAYNIFISKFAFFHEFFQLRKEMEINRSHIWRI